VRVTAIEPDGVRYTDHKGNEGKALCGSVLVSVGARPNTEQAMQFAGVAPRVLFLGDCDTVGNVQKAMRAGFSLASTF
jgi:Ni,Fe-hydrogenase I small subunit